MKDYERSLKELMAREGMRKCVQKVVADGAAEVVKSFKKPDVVTLKTGRLGLPQEVVCRILEFLCDEFEPNGYRLLTFVLEDLHSIALSCPDFLAALPYCYRRLAAKIVNPFTGFNKRNWDVYIADPTSFKVAELKEVLRDLYLKVTGSKAGKRLFSVRKK